MRRKLMAMIGAVALAAGLSLATVGAGTARAQEPELCHDPEYGGTFWCNDGDYTTGESLWVFPNGTIEVFVIGENFEVYTRWTNTEGELSDWVSLGGDVIDFPPLFYFNDELTQGGGGEWGITLVVVGTNGHDYFKQRGDSESSGWTADWEEWSPPITEVFSATFG